jgi:hypothetical protein
MARSRRSTNRRTDPVPAYTRRWTKTADTSTIQSFECRAYDVETVSPDPDMSEVQDQLQHAREQLAISARYPGRDRPQPLHRVRLKAVK